MKFLDLNNVGGRLANQMYFCLHAFVTAKRLNEEVKYIPNRACVQFNNIERLKSLNMGEFIADDIIDEQNIIYGVGDDYLQRVDVDFSDNDIQEFISKTVFNCEKFINFKNEKLKYLQESCVIHVRNGDYLEYDEFGCFDRKDYLKTCLDYINCDITPHKADRVVVVSDDSSKNKVEYSEILESKFKEIEYVSSDDLLTDMFTIALGKYKIIWNSTFSYWGAFIGNTLLNDRHLTFAPSVFTKHNPTSDHCLKGWNIMKVKMV